MSNVDQSTLPIGISQKELYVMAVTDDLVEEGFIERYKDFFKNPAPQQLQFARDMFNLLATNTDTSKLTVIPARCGIGKSLFIRALISYFCTFDTYDYRQGHAIGVIIVTDELKRLQEYQAEPEHLQSIWSGKSDDVSINKYSTCISSKSDKTALELLIESQYKPIVILTTQRYFSMSDDQRDMLLEYTYVNYKKQKTKKNREIIIFDEKPYFNNAIKIDAKNFNDCSTALQNGIPESIANRKDKDWMLQEYNTFRNKMTSLLREKEKTSSNVDRFYWRDHYPNNITSNDERFFELLEKYKKPICKQYADAITDFNIFKAIMLEGAFFTTTKNAKLQNYETHFQIFKDNKDKFYLGENKVKCFVFDATADIDTDYHLDYVKQVNCSDYTTPINMTINFLDIASSKSQLINDNNSDKQVKAIFETINKHFHNIGFGNTLLVTYKPIKDRFRNSGYDLGHFGGIKGINDFVKHTKFAHVGNNRFDPFVYFIKYLAQRPHVFEQLKKMSEEESREFILETTKLNKGLFENDILNRIMFSSIMADFEQNIFRTAIRNFHNKAEVKVYTFWNCKMFEPLNKLIEYRYDPFGVKFEYLGVPDPVQKMKTETRNTKDGLKTNPQKAMDFLKSKTKFTITEFKEHLNVDNQGIQAIKRNKAVSELFEEFKKVDKITYVKISA